MNGHPNKKQLIAYLLQSLKDKALTELTLHLKDCIECRNKVKSLRAIINESDNSLLNPPERLKWRILSSLKESNRESVDIFSKFKSGRGVLTRPLAFGTGILTAIVLIAIFYAQRVPESVDTVDLILAQANGQVRYNEKAIQKDSLRVKAGRISTASSSAALLTLPSVFSIEIAENTDLSIISVKAMGKDEKKRYNFTFDMKCGTIMAAWESHGFEKTFIITTKHAYFKALGTKFILKENDNSSELSVLEGSVRITALRGDEIHVLSKGQGCSINNRFRISTILPEKEIEKFKDLYLKRNKHRAYDRDKIENRDSARIYNNNLSEKDSVKEKEDIISEENKVLDTKEKEKQEADKVRKIREEYRKEKDLIKKEMRRNIRSGKRSRR